MITITYVSSAIQLFNTSELHMLLQKSREANLKHGITGMLLYNAGSFMQAIEGPDAAIKQLYLNIQRDKTHHMVTTLVEQQISERAFPEWSMGFNDLTALGRPSVEGFTHFLQDWRDRDEYSHSASYAKKLLQTFRENQVKGGYIGGIN